RSGAAQNKRFRTRSVGMRQNAIRLPQESDLGESVMIDRCDGGPRECLRGCGRRREIATPIRLENLDQPPACRIRECLKLPRAQSGGIRLSLAQQVAQSIGTPLQGPGSPGCESVFQVEPHDRAE